MAGNFIKDLPKFTTVQSTDELIVERVEGETRTTGRISYEDAIGFLIKTPNIESGTQTGTTVNLTGDFENYATVTVGGISYPSSYKDDGSIDVDITGLDAGSNKFEVFHAYKKSNIYTLITT